MTFDQKLNEREQAVFDDIAYDVANAIGRVLVKWQKHEPYIANALADTLATIVSISALEPPTALAGIAQRLKSAPWEEIRTKHFGYKLGASDGISDVRSGDIINIGPRPGKR